MQGKLNTFSEIIDEMSKFKTRQIPNFETDTDTYAIFSYLAEFEDGAWGPVT